ncbi:unnamed protein product [Porites evermanni]|uniref:Uncharacterized protein n=1 Tax=Porites evermanni TaxID=104178 RepID=A0ABN8MD73_9CNID|nr:unnamed protein product [Porites evermanni]
MFGPVWAIFLSAQEAIRKVFHSNVESKKENVRNSRIDKQFSDHTELNVEAAEFIPATELSEIPTVDIEGKDKENSRIDKQFSDHTELNAEAAEFIPAMELSEIPTVDVEGKAKENSRTEDIIVQSHLNPEAQVFVPSVKPLTTDQRPLNSRTDDIILQSQLNPEAQVFVPSVKNLSRARLCENEHRKQQPTTYIMRPACLDPSYQSRPALPQYHYQQGL